jgi:hypothetical protein
MALFFSLTVNNGSLGLGVSEIHADDCRSGGITVWGEAPVFTSVATSRDKAKEDACRTAIQKCIGEQVAAISGVSDGQAITNEIFTDAKGICKNDQIIEEKDYMLDTQKMLKVFVRFTVTKEAISERIDTMQKMVGNPKVIVLVREEYNIAGSGKKIEGFTSRSGVLSAALREFLISKGYTVIDPEAAGKSNEAAIAANPDTVPEDLKERAVKAGADVLIIGSIESNPQTIGVEAFKRSGLKSYKATGNISILSLWGAGAVLGEYSQLGNGAQTTDLAAARASVERYAIGSDRKKPEGLAKFVHKKLSDEWGRQTRNNLIQLKISGLDRKGAGTFRDDLIERTAVKTVNEISTTENSAEWEVTYPGKSFALADTLGFYGEDPRMFFVLRDTGKKLRVKEVKRGSIILSFE